MTRRRPASVGFDHDPLALCWRDQGRAALKRARRDRWMAKDQQGLTLAGSQQSAEAFDRAVADYYGLTGDPVGILKQALKNDPDFALGAVAIAGLFMIG